MEQRHFDRIAGFLREQSLLCFEGRRAETLRSHLRARMEALGLSDLGGYYDLLQSAEREQGELYDRVTVNETSFFRNAPQFKDLREVIVPVLEGEKGRIKEGSADKERRLRVLSAGCATGEEPYSIAMTLLEGLRFPLAWEIEILAGDLSDSCLEFASRGCYPEGRIAGIPEPYRKRYLRRERDGWGFGDGIRSMVRFLRLNLAQVIAGGVVPGFPPSSPPFDIIFCRNVLIYFPPQTQQLLIDALHELLAPGGYLCTGDAEPLHLYRHQFETVTEAASLIYRKKPDLTREVVAPLEEPPPPVSSVGELLLTVSQGAPVERAAARGRLLQTGMDEIADLLEDGVRNDRNADLRNGAMEILVDFGEAAVPMLLDLLEDRDEEVRNFATVMLGKIGSVSAVPQLILALRDPEPNVRHGAAEALGKIGDPRAVEPLLELLDQSFWLQFPAIAALGELGSSAPLPRLLQLLEDDLLFEPASQALQKIGDPAAIPWLRCTALGSDARRARIAGEAAAEIERRNELPSPAVPPGSKVSPLAATAARSLS